MPTSLPGDRRTAIDLDASAFLRRFGYLTGAGAPADDRADALRRFQQFHRLPVTGALDAATTDQMRRSRCALPDPTGPLAAGTLCAWDRTALTYAFDADSRDLADGPQRDAVRRALASWTAVCPVAFQEVAPSAEPDVRVGWRTVPDADYDLSGSTIAHSDYPPGCDIVTTALPKPVHFDDSENRWAVGRVDGAFDIESVALHEFGHILGLTHSAVAGAVMQPAIDDGVTRRVLADDDVEGVRSLYPPRITVIVRSSGLAVDVAGASTAPGAAVQQFGLTGGANQTFRLEPVASRRYRLVALHSGQVLTVPDASERAGARVEQRPWNGRLGQLFRIEDAGPGFQRLIADHSDLALGVDGPASGAQLIQTRRSDDDAQRLRFGFAAVTNRASGLVLDVPGRSVGSGVPLQQYPANGGRHQRLRIEPLGDGTFRLVIRESGKVLDIAFAGRNPGAAAVQSDWHGGDNQRFAVQSLPGGFVRIVAVHSGLALDTAGGSSTAGARIVPAAVTGRASQQWRL